MYTQTWLFKLTYLLILSLLFTGQPNLDTITWHGYHWTLYYKKKWSFYFAFAKNKYYNHRGVGGWHIYLNNIYKNKIYYMFCKQRVRLVIFLHLMTKVEISLVLFKILSLQWFASFNSPQEHNINCDKHTVTDWICNCESNYHTIPNHFYNPS
jgi:hypothetical protein